MCQIKTNISVHNRGFAQHDAVRTYTHMIDARP